MNMLEFSIKSDHLIIKIKRGVAISAIPQKKIRG